MKKSKLLPIVLSLALVCTSTNASSRTFAAGKPVTKSITLNVKSKHQMYVGTSKKIVVKSVAPKRSSKKVTFKSDTPSVVKIDQKGTMKALKAGSAKIIVTSVSNKKVKKKVKVTVKEATQSPGTTASDVTATQSPATTAPDVTATQSPAITAPEEITTQGPETIAPSETTTQSPATTTPDVATTQTPESTTPSVITSEEPSGTVESITFDQTEITLTHGKWAGLVMTVKPDDVKYEDIVVSSANTAIATAVNQGLNSKGEMIAGVVGGYPGVTYVTATVGGKTATCKVTVLEKEREADFAVPYISTRYFHSMPTTNEEVKIPYYMSDSKQSDYVKDDTSKKMNLLYEVDNQSYQQENISLGEQDLNLGKLPAGEHSIGIQVEDPDTGKKSHKVYVEVKVVDGTGKSYEVPAESFAAEEDITEQLNSLMIQKAEEGFYRIVLPENCTYTIDGKNGGLKIPSGVTLDLNGSTIKMKASTGASAAIVTMDKVEDAHITGGTLSGDKGETGASGAVAVRIIGSKYCSITNTKIENISGNGFVTERVESTFSRQIADNEFKRVLSTNDRESTITYTPLVDLTELKKESNYVMIGCNDYEKVVRAEFGMIYINFYDSDKNLISTVEGYQHRRTKIPENAQYAEAKVLGGLEGIDRIRFYYNELCENLEIKNVQFENIAKNAIMPTTFNHLLVEDCTFTGVAQRVAYIDEGGQYGAGGGWTEAQDLYYRNNTVTDGYKEVYFNTGRNLYLENLKGQNIQFGKGVLGGTIRDMEDSGMNINWTFGPFYISGYARIFDNTCKNINVKHIPNDKVFQPLPDYRIKNCNIAGDSFSSSPEYVEYVNCTFTNFNGNTGILRGCTLNEDAKVGADIMIYNE